MNVYIKMGAAFFLRRWNFIVPISWQLEVAVHVMSSK